MERKILIVFYDHRTNTFVTHKPKIKKNNFHNICTGSDVSINLPSGIKESLYD